MLNRDLPNTPPTRPSHPVTMGIVLCLWILVALLVPSPYFAVVIFVTLRSVGLSSGKRTPRQRLTLCILALVLVFGSIDLILSLANGERLSLLALAVFCIAPALPVILVLFGIDMLQSWLDRRLIQREPPQRSSPSLRGKLR